MRYILALDQGTSSSRAVVVDRAGRVRAVAQRELSPVYPQPGWVEQDPNEIWASQAAVVGEVLQAARLSGADIAAMGISNQRETTIVWDRQTGRPIWNAIVWQDRRTAELCGRLRDEGRADLFRRKTGLVLDAYFSGTKLAWLLDRVPDARRRAEQGRLAFGTVDSWLVWQLTKGRAHLTDVTNASRTLLYNIHTGEWDAELLEVLNIPPGLLPEVRPSSQVCAETATELWGAAIPIAGLAGDQQAALFGQRCHTPGTVKNTYGTGCFLLMPTGARAVRSDHRLLTTPAWQLSGRTLYALEGSVFIGGAVVQWLRDGLGMIRASAEVEPLAASVPDTGGVYLVPAFAGLGAPHWDPYARGTLVGLTRGTSAAHIARAALESIAYQSRDVVAAMEADAGLSLTELRVDGGATANNLLMQFQADILGVPVVRPRVTETSALGAAYLAGLAVGYWTDQSQLDAQWQVERIFEPSMPADRRTALIADWQRAVERAKAWATP